MNLNEEVSVGRVSRNSSSADVDETGCVMGVIIMLTLLTGFSGINSKLEAMQSQQSRTEQKLDRLFEHRVELRLSDVTPVDSSGVVSIEVETR